MPTSNAGYKDLLHFWPAGAHDMDVEKLKTRLKQAKLILGNIGETLPSFLDQYTDGEIACLFVDVDYYSSTLPILSALEDTNEDRWLPRVYMYFDDTNSKYEFSGETLAIKEFNQRNESMKISPELTFDFESKNKICHRFNNKLYNERIIDTNKNLSLR